MDVLLIILAANIAAAAGQVLLKVGMGDVGVVNGIYIEKLVQIFTNPAIIAGLIVYVIGTVFWLTALSRKDLSYVYPFFAVTVVLVMVLSHFILHETIGWYRIAGIAAIVVGVILVSGT
jgi:drug/metabolite transporter (DMT)-like permease